MYTAHERGCDVATAACGVKASGGRKGVIKGRVEVAGEQPGGGTRGSDPAAQVHTLKRASGLLYLDLQAAVSEGRRL